MAARRPKWGIVNGVKRSLRDVMFLVVPIRGLKPTATIISHCVTQATVASRQRILAVGFNPRKGFIHGLRRVATAHSQEPRTAASGGLLKLKLATQCLLKLNPLAADSILLLHRQDAGLIGFPNGRWGVRYVELIIQVPDMGDHGVLRNRQCLGNLLAQ